VQYRAVFITLQHGFELTGRRLSGSVNIPMLSFASMTTVSAAATGLLGGLFLVGLIARRGPPL
jgi:hypothetical protein